MNIFAIYILTMNTHTHSHTAHTQHTETHQEYPNKHHVIDAYVSTSAVVLNKFCKTFRPHHKSLFVEICRRMWPSKNITVLDSPSLIVLWHFGAKTRSVTLWFCYSDEWIISWSQKSSQSMSGILFDGDSIQVHNHVHQIVPTIWIVL